MATVTRENIGVLNDKIVIKVEKEDYLPSFEKAVKDYSKRANIPGFRKGMVPAGMIKKMMGSAFFAEEINKTVEKNLVDYMQAEKLDIFAQPLPLPENDNSAIDMNQPTEYAFAFEVGLKPDFAVANLSDAQLNRYKISVTDQMVDEQINQLQTHNGINSPQEAVTAADNKLDMQFIESDAEGNEVTDGIKENKTVTLKDFTPAYQDQLMGKKTDDSLVISLSQAFEENKRKQLTSDFNVEETATDHYFKVVITKIELMEKLALDTQFFEQVFPGKDVLTEEAFRNAIKQDIQDQWDKQSNDQLNDQIYHYLLNHTRIDFPEHFLKRWMQVSGEKEKTPDEVEQAFPSFVNQLKWSLIVDKLVDENNIEVLPEDIRGYAKNQLLGYMGNSMDFDHPWVENYLDKMMADKKFVENSFNRIRAEKAFSWAGTRINAVEAEISENDFIKKLEDHKHQH